jgi:hypothetical protein
MRRTLVAILLLSAAPAARAQRTHVSALGSRGAIAELAQPAGVFPAIVAPGLSASTTAQPKKSTAWAIAASALVPGSGQFLLGVQRALPYLAFEGFAWAQYGAHSGETRARRRDYKTLAARVARAPFSPTQPPGSFEYYERMEKYLESGAYNRSGNGTLQPETDTTTYNGFVWLLARRTYWEDENGPGSAAELDSALTLYKNRAYRPEYLWSWQNAQVEHDEFRKLVRQSNDASRKSLQDIGVIIANHALSTVDAYITVRVRRRRDARVDGYEFAASIPVRLPR